MAFPGKHIYNIHNKNDTFTAEGVNADLRHYIPTLPRRSRCFPRKLEDLQAVLAVFTFFRLLTKSKTPRKIALVNSSQMVKWFKDKEGKKDGTSCLQRAGGRCEPVGEFRGSLLPESFA